MAGHASPTAAPVVREALRGFTRKAAKSTQKQAKGLTADAVAAVRGSLAVKAGILAARDLAIVALMACTGLADRRRQGWIGIA